MTQLQYTDLMTKCTACNGFGYVDNPAWRGVGPDTWSTAEARDFIREHGNEELPCGECNGTGERLTETGEVLYLLIRPMIDGAIAAHERRYHRSTP